jgi:uncharacterized protein YegP (UPF0339 family)
MATATKKVHTARPVTRSARDVSESPLEFLVYGDNSGNYRWEIVGGSGDRLAQSGTYASHDDAERAARYAYDGAGSARFEANPPEQR